MAEYKESDTSELMGFVDWKGRPAVKGRHGGMTSTFFVYGTEVTDNIASAAVLINLVTYLTGFMHVPIAEAANTVTNYAGTGLIIALAGAFVSDAYINKFKTCVVSLCIELLGYIILLIQAHYNSLKPPPCNRLDPSSVCIKIGGGKAGMLLVGLYLVAIGGGGVKGSLAPLGADQLDETDPIERRKRSNYFNMFFLSLSIGAALGVTVVVWMMNNKGWDIGFGICIGVVFLGLISIVSGIKRYRYKVPSGSFLTCIVQVFVAALRNRKLSIPEDLNDPYEPNDKEIGKQGEKLSHSKQFKVTQVEEVKILVRMMPIFASTIAMNTCLAQLQTFYAAQGVTTDRSMGKHFDIPAASLPIIPLVFLFIVTPLYDRVFVPLARKFTGHESGITHLQRVGVGLFLSGVSMGIAALVEVKRKNVARDNGMLDAIPLIMPPLPISIFWLAFQYFVFGIAELFLFAALLEFFYTEAPPRMRSLATSFSWVSLSMGFFLSTIIVDIVNAATRNITKSHGWLAGNNLNRNHLNLFYWLLAGLSMLNFFNYVFWSSWYQYKPVVLSQVTDDASALDCSISF